VKRLHVTAIIIALVALVVAPLFVLSTTAVASDKPPAMKAKAAPVPVQMGTGVRRVMGLNKAEPGDYPRLYSSAADKKSLPSKFDLTSSTNAELPVGDQGSQGSCVGWATGYYYKSFQEEAQHHWDISKPEFRFSPSWIYNQACGGRDQGTTFPAAFNVMINKGVVDIQEFPYSASDYTRKPDGEQLQAAKPYRVKSYGALWMSPGGNDVSDIKAHIAAGDQVVIGIPVYSSFYNCSSSFVGVPRSGEDYFGGHALCVVGYDDSAGGGRGGMKVINSWGGSWGKNGSTYLSYDFMRDYTWEAWVMTDSANDQPKVDSISPDRGKPGSLALLKGENFGTNRGASGVLFGNKAAEVTGWNNGNIIVKVPAGASDGSVKVVNWAGQGSNGVAFDVDAYISSVSPDVATAGNEATIYGGGFGTGRGEVVFAEEKVQVVHWSECRIVFKVPGGNRSGMLTVIAGGQTSNAVLFRVAGSVWYLAEGYTGGDFEEWILVENAESKSNMVQIIYMTEDGPVDRKNLILLPSSRATVSVDADLQDENVSVKLVSDGKILVERAMYWGGRIEGHNSAGVQLPRENWFMGEGCTDYGFDTWVLVQNPGCETATVKVTYLTDQGPVEKAPFTVAPNTRATVHVNEDIPGRNISVKVEADRGVVVERSMYWDGKRGGHNSSAAPDASKEWYLAEGSTMNGFDEWLTLGNPSEQAANVQITYMTPGGPVPRAPLHVPGNTRATVHVNEDIVSDAVSVRVVSDAPVVAERSMYWNNGTGRAGHGALGIIQPSTTQYLAEGCTTSSFQEWVLLQNPSDTEAASVSISYMTPEGPVPGRQITLAPASRQTVLVNGDIAPNDVSVEVQSSKPVIVERAMYWNNRGGGHDSPGITSER